MKKMLSLCLILLVVIPIALTGCGVDRENMETSETNIISESLDSQIKPYRIGLYYSEIYPTKDTFSSGYFGAASGEGKRIRFWFRNTGTGLTTVSLYKKAWIGSDKCVASFKVPAGGDKQQIYTANNADRGTYELRLSTGGEKIQGEVAAAQLDDNDA